MITLKNFKTNLAKALQTIDGAKDNIQAVLMFCFTEAVKENDQGEQVKNLTPLTEVYKLLLENNRTRYLAQVDIYVRAHLENIKLADADWKNKESGKWQVKTKGADILLTVPEVSWHEFEKPKTETTPAQVNVTKRLGKSVDGILDLVKNDLGRCKYSLVALDEIEEKMAELRTLLKAARDSSQDDLESEVDEMDKALAKVESHTRVEKAVRAKRKASTAKAA